MRALQFKFARPTKSVFLFASILLSSFCAFAQVPKPVLIELFTSEGCSSCPPAEALLRVLDSTQPVPGAQLIVLEEHVDYWDDQGWKDPFSSHLFTLRQTDYVDRLHLKEGPYTPQMVVDGTDAFVGSNRSLVAQALKKAVGAAKINLELSSLRADNGKAFAHLSTGTVPSKSEVFIVLALDHAQSQVLHGENGGKQLDHVAVVKRLSTVGKIKKGESFSKDLDLGSAVSGHGYRLIAFVQQTDGPVLGATVVHLP